MNRGQSRMMRKMEVKEAQQLLREGQSELQVLQEQLQLEQVEMLEVVKELVVAKEVVAMRNSLQSLMKSWANSKKQGPK